MRSKLRHQSFVIFIGMILIVQAILFRSSAVVSIDRLLRTSGYASSGQFLCVVLFLLTSACLGVLMLKWTLEPKHLLDRGILHYFSLWICVVVALVTALGLKILVMERYQFLDSINKADAISASQTTISLLLVSAPASITFIAAFKWLSPPINKIDYTTIKTIIPRINMYLHSNKMAIHRKFNLHPKQQIEKLLNLVEKAEDEIEKNIVFEDCSKYLSNLEKTLENIFIIKEFLLRVIELDNVHDISVLLAAKTGGFVTERVQGARRYLLAWPRL